MIVHVLLLPVSSWPCISINISIKTPEAMSPDLLTSPHVGLCTQVLMDMHSRPLSAMRPALIINLDVKDSHEEAALAAPHALELCSIVSIAWQLEAENSDWVVTCTWSANVAGRSTLLGFPYVAM